MPENEASRCRRPWASVEFAEQAQAFQRALPILEAAQMEAELNFALGKAREYIDQARWARRVELNEAVAEAAHWAGQ